jgi:hypothetical protein
METLPPSKAVSCEAESTIEGLLGNLWAINRRKFAAWKRPAIDFRRLLERDYVRGLRRGLRYADVKSLVGAFAEIFPGFNQRSVAMMDGEDYRRIADRFGIHLKAAPYVEHDGMALRGFYVAGAPGYLKRPLIFVNTAHHQIAAGSSFIHELGHHVAKQRLGLPAGQVNYFFDAEYSRHLSDCAELAADVTVSLAGYPVGVARRIFSTPWNWGLVARATNLTGDAFAEVRLHLKKSYGFDLQVEEFPQEQRLRYLAGMIHYAKLRWALLAEYDL